MKFKRFISIILVLALVLSSFSFAMAAPAKNIKELSDEENTKEVSNSSLVTSPRTKGLEDDDEVRIIVELSDKPVIEYATEKNVSFTKLNSETVKTVTEKLVNSQISVKSTISKNNIKVDYHSSFVNVINGFSGTTTYGEAKDIEKLPGVVRVVLANEYSRPVPEMNNSLDLVNARATWSELGYDGEGMVVAIVDTGIDPSHKDMVLTNPENARLSESDIEAIIDEEDLGGKYFTSKVPYGYNYLDNNQEILDLGPDASRHGMHVAGTVGANGDEEEDGIKGVAPEVQLLAMKVFGNNPTMPSTYGDIIIKAIDDSVKLGADVINMSLGATAQFVKSDDPEQQAVTRAVENGVFMSISAGNSDKLGSGWANPYASNPDVGVIGAPGLTAESMQVAAASNKLFLYESNVTVGDLEIIGYGKDDWEDRGVSGDLELIAIGGTKLGELSDYDGIDVTDKVVLVSRGEHSFYDKTEWADEKGAIGIIVYDHENANSNFYYDLGGWSIPFMKIHKADGLALEELLEEGTITINVGTELEYLDPATGALTYFSSWGTTPNLNFKPDITAPGGGIYSTDQNDGYQYMSGTSMAAPHVAGGAALVLQEVNSSFSDLSGKEKIEMAKNLIMSTANIVEERFEFTSPRRQGAGGMDLVKAITTPAIITDGTESHNTLGLSKVELKEIDDLTTFTLTVDNFSDETIQYAVYGSIATDLAVSGENYGEPQPVLSSDADTPLLTFELEDGTVIDNVYSVVYAEANGSTSFDVTIDLSEATDWLDELPLQEVFPNGNFIEGFIQLKDMNDDNDDVDLSIPYIGFYGEWDMAPIIDDNIYDEDGSSFYGYTSLVWNHGLLDLDNFNLEELNEFMGSYALGLTSDGPDESKIAFSPNGDGYADTAIPLLSFLRNARELDINILDDDGEKLRDLSIQEYISKNYYDYGGPVVTVDDIWEWDGTANNELAEDGQYYYEINSIIDYDDADWQTVTLPIRIDTVAPVMEAEPEYSLENNTITASANDGDYGISHYELIEDEEILASSSDGSFDISDISGSHEVVVRAFDYAMNFVDSDTIAFGEDGENEDSDDEDDEEKIEPTEPAEGDETIPTVMLDEETIEYGATFSTSSITVNGYVSDESSMEEFKIDGEDVDLVFNTETGNWDFETVMDFSEDGLHGFDIDAKDSAGNAINFEHVVIIDTTKPIIDISIPTSTKSSKVNIKGTITDNLYDLKVRINGNMVANIDGSYEYYDSFVPASYDIDVYQVSLDKGSNLIIIEAEDTAGNVTVKEFNVTRKSSSGSSSGSSSSTSSEEDKPLISKNISTKTSTIKDEDEKVELRFEKGTFDKTESVEVEVLEEKEVEKLDKINNHTRVSDVYEFTTSAKEFKKSVKVTLKYDKSKIEDINEELLGVYTFDEEEDKWVYVGGKLDKESNTISADLEHFSKYTVMASTKVFEDTKDHWADHEIKVAAAREIINGMDGVNYAPEEEITKAQFAKIISVLLGLEEEDYSGTFTDIPEDEWYTGYIEAALKAGVIDSKEKEFNPNTSITREEMAMMVAQALTYQDDSKAEAGELTFEDKSDISEEALEAVAIAVEHEIINGMTETTFAPKENATRAQAAVMVYRLLKALDRI